MPLQICPRHRFKQSEQRELRVGQWGPHDVIVLLQLTSRRPWSRRALGTLHERWYNCRTHSKLSFRVASLWLTHLHTTQHALALSSPRPRLCMRRRWHNHRIWPTPVSLIYTTLHPSGTWRESPKTPTIRDTVGRWWIVRPCQ